MRIKLIILSLILASCAEQTIAPKVSSAELEQEQQIQHDMLQQGKIAGYEVAPKLTPEMKSRFSRIANQIGVAGEGLCVQMGKEQCRFGFELKEDKALNAYADGDKIVITTAMLEFASKDEELANVIAHEYAHNIMQHIQSKKGNALLGTLAGMAIDVAIGSGDVASQFGSNIGAGSYSIAFEKEADYVGLYIFARTGYDANQAIEFWRKMSLANASAIDVGVTHPTNPERFVAMKKTIAEIKNKQQQGLPLMPEVKS